MAVRVWIWWAQYQPYGSINILIYINLYGKYFYYTNGYTNKKLV